MAEPTRQVDGDFHVIRMDNLFHVVFRPDSDPEWFRIIGSFYTYERAFIYCDIERVSTCIWKDEKGEDVADSCTGDEEMAGLRAPPVHLELPSSGGMADREGVAELVRGVYDAAEHVAPHSVEDFSEHPNENEPPKEYHDRQWQKAVAKEADRPTCAECGKPRHPSSARLCRNCYRVTPADSTDPLTPNQTKALKFFQSRANPLHLVSATYRQIADGAGLLKASTSGIVESLERRGLLEVVERGKPGYECVFRLTAQGIEARQRPDREDGLDPKGESPAAVSDAPK